MQTYHLPTLLVQNQACVFNTYQGNCHFVWYNRNLHAFNQKSTHKEWKGVINGPSQPMSCVKSVCIIKSFGPLYFYEIDLCLTEKLVIPTADQNSMLNRKYELLDTTPPLLRDLVKISTRKLWHTSSFSLERTDFKNVIFEKIPWAHSEVAEVAEVKRPRNSKQQKF